MAWFALWVMGSDVGVLSLFRDSRFLSPATGRSDTVVESRSWRLFGSDLGVFRPANAYVSLEIVCSDHVQ